MGNSQTYAHTHTHTHTHRYGVGVPSKHLNVTPVLCHNVISFPVSMISSLLFPTSHILLCGIAHTWCSSPPIWWTAEQMTHFSCVCFFNIWAIFVSVWCKSIRYTYCMDMSFDVALLVVYYYHGGTLKIVLKAHLYSTTNILALVNVCFEHAMTFTVDRACCCQVQNTWIPFNCTVRQDNFLSFLPSPSIRYYMQMCQYS